MDRDIGVKPECDDEKAGTGSKLAAKADEGGAVFFDQPAGSRRKTFTASDHPINKKSSVVRVTG